MTGDYDKMKSKDFVDIVKRATRARREVERLIGDVNEDERDKYDVLVFVGRKFYAYKDKEMATQEFLNCLSASEGSEKERYSNVLYCLLHDLSIASDEDYVSEKEQYFIEGLRKLDVSEAIKVLKKAGYQIV